MIPRIIIINITLLVFKGGVTFQIIILEYYRYWVEFLATRMAILFASRLILRKKNYIAQKVKNYPNVIKKKIEK